MRSILFFTLFLAACADKEDETTDFTDTATETGDTETEPTDTQTTPTGDTETTDTQTTPTTIDTAPTDTATTSAEVIEILGSYTDAWGSTHEITESSWSFAYPGYSAETFWFLSFDNELQYMIAENDALNSYSAGLFSRFDWVEYNGDLYYCQTAFGAATEMEAMNTPAADPADPTAGGCGGFPWTNLTP